MGEEEKAGDVEWGGGGGGEKREKRGVRSKRIG